MSGNEIETEYVTNYLKKLINRIYKIMPMKESSSLESDINKSIMIEDLSDYIRGLTHELEGQRYLLSKPIGLELLFSIGGIDLQEEDKLVAKDVKRCLSIIETYIRLIERENIKINK